MKFGVVYNTAHFGVDRDDVLAFAEHAEACGFESFYVTEHIAGYPGARIGETDVDPALPFADPLELLAFVAAATGRILLGTAVLLIPYHHPVLLAKRLATLDVLSKGRMRLTTVGLGNMPGEGDAVGVEFASRGRRADEAIDVLRLLWSGDERGVSFEGEFFSFPAISIYPKPYSGSTLPIHVGGSSRAGARRAGLRGDGWFPGGMVSRADRAAHLELVRATAREAGRDPGAIEYTRWASLELSPDAAEGFARQGVSRLVIGGGSPDPERRLDELSEFADRFQLRRSG